MDKKSLYLFTTLFTTFSLFALNSAQVIQSATTHLVISEVQIAGVGANHDFVELYNPTGSDIDISNYRLVKRSATGTTDTSLKAFDDGEVVSAGGYYLWANNSWTPEVSPDASTAGTLAADNGIAVRDGAENTGTIIDSVGWGAATNAFVETAAFPTNPPAGSSLERIGDDTNNNSVDFGLKAESEPQNSQSMATSSPTPSATATTTSTPTMTSTPTPTVTATMTSTMTPTSTPVVTSTPTATPTVTATATPTAAPTSTPSGQVIARFYGANGKTRECRLEYKTKHFGFFILQMPKIKCEWL